MLITIQIKKEVTGNWTFNGGTEPAEKGVKVRVIAENWGATVFEGSVAEGLDKIKSFLGRKWTDKK